MRVLPTRRKTHIEAIHSLLPWGLLCLQWLLHTGAAKLDLSVQKRAYRAKQTCTHTYTHAYSIHSKCVFFSHMHTRVHNKRVFLFFSRMHAHTHTCMGSNNVHMALRSWVWLRILAVHWNVSATRRPWEKKQQLLAWHTSGLVICKEARSKKAVCRWFTPDTSSMRKKPWRCTTEPCHESFSQISCAQPGVEGESGCTMMCLVRERGQKKAKQTLRNGKLHVQSACLSLHCLNYKSFFHPCRDRQSLF